MGLNDRMAPAAFIAKVSFSGSHGCGAVWESEKRGFPFFAPPGIASLPCEGDQLMMLGLERGEAAIGTASDTLGLEPGELRLRSKGGAEIVLHNNGEITLNGLAITKDGKIIEP